MLAATADIAGKDSKVVAIEPVADTPDQGGTAAPGQQADSGEQTATSTDAPAVSDSPPPATEVAVPQGWSVQVASAASEEGAWTTYKNMQSRHRVLADRKPIVVKADLGAKGTFFRVRFTGFENQADAKSACSKLKSGGVSCFISKSAS